MREEIKTLNGRLAAAAPLAETRKRKLEGRPAALHRYHLDTIDKSKLNKYFVIQQTDEDQYMMGDKEVMIDENSNIHVDGVQYMGTPGLWMLVMLSSPKDYTSDYKASTYRCKC